MNPVEVGILERVARLNRGVFRALDSYAQRHGAFQDPAVAAFASELPFYLGWLELIRPLQDAGLPFCYPDVSTTDARTRGPRPVRPGARAPARPAGRRHRDQ